MRDGDAGEDEACDDEHCRFGQRGQMLRLAVSVLMADVGRTHGDADREERQERGDEIRCRVERLRDEAEAAGGGARPEL